VTVPAALLAIVSTGMVYGTAATLSCSVGTVKSQAARGLARLREITGDAGGRDIITGKGAGHHD
jgi:hypothetical protein